MPRRPRLSASALVALVFVTVGACSPGGSPTPTGGGPTQSPAPPVGIEHAIGATDLVLRFDEAGGMMRPSGTEGPAFSLYGDGTVYFRDAATAPAEPVGGISLGSPYQVVRLTEEQIQSLLEFAVGPGGLGVARAQYILPVADLPTATFLLVAGATRKVVSVNGLGFGADGGPDAFVLSQLEALKKRLTNFAGEIVGERPWTPERYRGILEENAFNPPAAWPWPAIAPSDFVLHKGPDDPFLPVRTMTLAEVAVLGVSGLEGGAQGFTFTGPDGKVYEFRLRPLLPDEPF